MDLTPLIEENAPEVEAFVKAKLNRFTESVLNGLTPSAS